MIEIHLIFTTSNQLKMTIANSVNQHLGLKICFSLVYSIESVDGGAITKKVGRYYEILSEKSEIFLTLQKTKIGSYNLSCGPEGLFVIYDNDKKLECFIHPLTFESPIPRVHYPEHKEKILEPVIPLPFSSQLKQEFIKITNLKFKIQTQEQDFFKNIKNITEVSNIHFNTEIGHKIVFLKQNLEVEEYKILIDKKLITINYSDYGGKFYSIITLVQLINFYKSELPLGLI